MAAEWRVSTWGEEISLEYGKALRGYDTTSGKFRVFGSNGPIGWTAQPLAPGPGVILGRKGAYRGIEFSREPFFVIDTAYYVVPKSELDMRWLYYAIKYHKLGEIDDGSPIPSTTRSAVYVRDFDVPPLPEQRAIARILGTLDDKIELNRRMNETLEAIARTIFKSWFVDFDPVRAKVEGRNPGLPKRIADFFPERSEDSELGEIPEGWRVGTVNDVAIINARTLGRNDSLETIDYIEISEVMRGEVNTVTRYQRGQEPSRARRRLQNGDTVLSTVRPDRGAYFLSLEPPETLIASTGFVVLTPKTGQWAFLDTVTTQQGVGEELGRLADGGAYPAVRPEVVGGLPVILPDDANLTDAYEALSQPLFRRPAMNRRESRALAALRDALLPKLLSGEIRVADAEKIVEGIP